MIISGNTVPFALSEKNMNIHHDYFAIQCPSAKPPFVSNIYYYEQKELTKT